MKFKWYTNGITDIKVYDDSVIPNGFIPGRRTKGREAWNKGLTKNDNPNLKGSSTSFKKGDVPWNKGLTKETNSTLMSISEKVSEKNKGKIPHNKGKKMSDESRKKLSESCMGRESWAKGKTKETNESIKRISDKLMGHEVSDETIQKGWETKHRNGTCKSSKPEEHMYQYLVEKYGKDNVFRNYSSDERYPFAVDFYVKPLDLFIELNLFWVHNTHPFDATNNDDIKELHDWEMKAEHSEHYQSAINTWTVKDVVKLNVARDNNLNFMFIYKNNLIIDR